MSGKSGDRKNAICTESYNEVIVLIGKVRKTFLEHFEIEVVNWIANLFLSFFFFLVFWRIVPWMKMKMHFQGLERRMKRLINSMMIHLGQVQLVSGSFLFSCLGLLPFSSAAFYQHWYFCLAGISSFTELADFSILHSKQLPCSSGLLFASLYKTRCFSKLFPFQLYDLWPSVDTMGKSSD